MTAVRTSTARRAVRIHGTARSVRRGIALLALAASAVGAQETAASDAGSLMLRPGDAVKLTVWKVPELDGEFMVAPDGSIAHPAFPSLHVAGVPLRRVQVLLDSAARVENVNARVVLQPLLRVVVGGEVASPNLYRHPAGTSVAEAIILAGGTTESANPRRLALVRDGATMYFDLTDPAGLATHALVQSGDQLLVQRKGRSFRDSFVPFISALGTAASIATLILRSR